jgi:predicted DNA-binding transcriptional regulator AlpA
MQNHMGPQTSGQAHPKPVAHSLPANLADVALIEATTCAAAGAMSVSWWHQSVKDGRAPAPVIRQPRCTRWRLSDVRAFWEAFARQANTDPHAGAAVTAQATKASRAARAKRVAANQTAAGVK